MVLLYILAGILLGEIALLIALARLRPTKREMHPVRVTLTANVSQYLDAMRQAGH
jgi:hypothetical protein